MAEPVFPLRILEAELHAARLVVCKIGTAGYLEILTVTGRPHFDVIRSSSSEPDVTATKFNYPIVEVQGLEDGLCVAGKLFKSTKGFVRVHNLDKFDLVKLMDPDDSTGVPSCTPGLSSPNKECARSFLRGGLFPATECRGKGW